MSYSTIEDRTHSRVNYFTFIRHLAAYAVLFAHSYAPASGHPGQDPITRVVRAWQGAGPGFTNSR